MTSDLPSPHSYFLGIEGNFLVPGIGAASSLLLLQGAKREAIIRLLVWMAAGILIYLVYGRTHSEVNNPRLVAEEPMRIIHENYSVNSIGEPRIYQGYTDDDLRRQYERQLARHLDPTVDGECIRGDGRDYEMHIYQGQPSSASPYTRHSPRDSLRPPSGPEESLSGTTLPK